MSRINILLFGKNGRGLNKPGGAARAMFEYANHLVERGHEVNILISAYNAHPKQHDFYEDHQQAGWSIWKYWEKRLSITNRLRALQTFFAGKQALPCEWFDLKPKMHLVPTFEEKYIPDGEVVMVLDWWMLLWASAYPKSKGRKVWFIHTIFFLPPTKRYKEILALPFKKIGVSSFMRKEIERRGGENVSVVLNGVNLKQFYNEHKVFNKDKRIGMVYFDSAPFKGVEDGIKAFEMARMKHPEIKLVMLGVEKGKDAPQDCEFHWNPDQARIKDIYSSCDIFLFPGRKEAFANTPFEAMACQCALVATTAGGIPDVVVSEETALLSSPEDVDALARNLIRAIEDQALLERISAAGFKRIQELSWANQTKELEKIILG